jgi:hypothetical protein
VEAEMNELPVLDATVGETVKKILENIKMTLIRSARKDLLKQRTF